MAYFEKRGKSTRAVVTIDGKKERATFDTKAEAVAWADHTEKKKAIGTLAGGKGGHVRLIDLLEEYMAKRTDKTDTAKWNRLRITRWMDDPMAQLRLVEIDTATIDGWIERQGERENPRTGKSPTKNTIRRELELLSGAFTYAVKVREWLTSNPCRGAAWPGHPPPRNRPLLTEDEIEQLLIATGYHQHPNLDTLTSRVGACFLLALETGMRSGEMLRLRPEDYWRDKRTAHVAAIDPGGRKNARSGKIERAWRHVPLTETAIALLDRLLATMPANQQPLERQPRPPYIFGLNDAQRDALWRKCTRRAGVEDLTFHDLKHQACTHLCKHLDIFELSHAVGTKSLKLLRDTYYVADASRAAASLPKTNVPRRASLHVVGDKEA